MRTTYMRLMQILLGVSLPSVEEVVALHMPKREDVCYSALSITVREGSKRNGFRVTRRWDGTRTDPWGPVNLHRPVPGPRKEVSA